MLTYVGNDNVMFVGFPADNIYDRVGRKAFRRGNSRHRTGTCTVSAFFLKNSRSRAFETSLLLGAEFLDTLVPFGAFDLCNHRDKTEQRVLYIALYRKIGRNILVKFRRIYVYVDYLEILAETLLVARRSVGESCSESYHKIGFVLSNR